VFFSGINTLSAGFIIINFFRRFIAFPKLGKGYVFLPKEQLEPELESFILCQNPDYSHSVPPNPIRMTYRIKIQSDWSNHQPRKDE
jgi:hypothetical protein